MLQALEARIKDLGQKLESSAANHNALLGAMQVLRELYNEAVAVAPVIEAIDPALIPVIQSIEAVVSEVEAVV
jgi:hypothetical protein